MASVQLPRRVPSKKQMSWIKSAIFLLCLVPLVRLVWLGVNDGLGANPVEFVERSTGFWALVILLATLSLTPVRLLWGVSWQLQFRRMVGLMMFFYASLHITAYLWLDYGFDWADIMKDIIKHPYVLVGAAAYLLTVPLAVTSNQYMMQVLRQHWKQLHLSVYLIATLGVVHFWWLVKKDIREPLFYALVLAVLLGIRLFYKLRQVKLKIDKARKVKLSAVV
nr:protein-methionine-sulfoxide reductase heme-binding subunit MsrQ [uncultured Methylotenera sp.]